MNVLGDRFPDMAFKFTISQKVGTMTGLYKSTEIQWQIPCMIRGLVFVQEEEKKVRTESCTKPQSSFFTPRSFILVR